MRPARFASASTRATVPSLRKTAWELPIIPSQLDLICALFLLDVSAVDEYSRAIILQEADRHIQENKNIKKLINDDPTRHPCMNSPGGFVARQLSFGSVAMPYQPFRNLFRLAPPPPKLFPWVADHGIRRAIHSFESSPLHLEPRAVLHQPPCTHAVSALCPLT